MKKEWHLPTWAWWTMGGVLISTALVVLMKFGLHPQTIADVSLNVSKISFRTNGVRILAPTTEEQLLIARIASLEIRGRKVQMVEAKGLRKEGNSFQVQVGPAGSCSFYRVRSSALELMGTSIITLGWAKTAAGGSASLQVHGTLKGALTSQPSGPASKSGFSCIRVHTDAGSNETVEGTFSPQGGDSILFTTAPDTRLVIELTSGVEIGDTQIPILDEIQLSDIDPQNPEEKTVLLTPPAGHKNEILFQALDKTVGIHDDDLVVMRPGRSFYLRRFVVKDGIQLSLHGELRDLRAGAGVSDLQTRMPSLIDHLKANPVVSLLSAFGGMILTVLAAVLRDFLRKKLGLKSKE